MFFRDDENSRLLAGSPTNLRRHDCRANRNIPPAIRASGLTKRYGEILAVDGLDLEIASGQFFGLLGPNGSGKTTTIHMLATLIRPTAGSAEVAGFDMGRHAVRARETIGIVFQESALDRSLTVAENLRFAGLLLDMPTKVIAERSGELLELFGLQEHRAKPVATLSGGMRRALDIVRGVLHQPRILFLDEPTIGLDLPNRRRIWRFIEKLRSHTAMTVLLTTHYLEEADSCDRVSFIRKGRIVESGTPRAMVEAPGQTHCRSGERRTSTVLLRDLNRNWALPSRWRHCDVPLGKGGRHGTGKTPIGLFCGQSAAGRYAGRTSTMSFLWVAGGKALKS